MNSPKIGIIIPARYNSTRFPGKPLALLQGKATLQHVWQHAKQATRQIPHSKVIVATDDERIFSFCKHNQIDVTMTSNACKNGTERILEVFYQEKKSFDFIVNLQGDNPLCPASFISSLCQTFINHPKKQRVMTLMTHLTWEALHQFKEHKKTNPFSGTSVICNLQNYALYFSKNIIPAIRNQENLEKSNSLSPVRRHIGLYGYTKEILTLLPTLHTSYYEDIEGLEQLRFLENNIPIECVNVQYEVPEMSSLGGIDTKEDLARAEILLQKLQS